MPILHLVNHKEKIVFVRIIGDIPTDEVIGSLRKFGKSSKVPDNYDILIDLRKCQKSSSYNEAKRIIDAWGFAMSKYSQKCVFLASEAVLYGESRMAATLAELEGHDAHATRSEDEACKLLGISTLPSDEQYAQDGFEL